MALLVDGARPDFKAKGYGQAAASKHMDGIFILKANEVELSLLFSQMGVAAVDMPKLREAVASWKADPAQAFECIAAEQQVQQTLPTPIPTTHIPNPKPQTPNPTP